jgi:molybdopterin-guanine dinucleotide biosynthesis protein A
MGSEALLTRISRILGELAQPLFAVAAAGQALPPLAGGAQRLDDELPGLGPLEGLRLGLQAAQREGAEAAALYPSDSPFPCAAVVQRLEELRLESGAEIAVARVGGRSHPLAAATSTHTGDAAALLLAQGQRRVHAWLERLRVRWVSEEELLACENVRGADPRLLHFLNVNTPEDYALALNLLAQARAKLSYGAR